MRSNKTGCSRCNRNNCPSTTPSTFTAGHGLLKFFLPLAGAGASFGDFFSDGGAVSATAPIYPAAASRTLQGLAARFDSSVPLPAGSITVQLYKNGSPVPGFSVTFAALTAVGAIATTSATTPPSVTIAPGDTFALKATGDASISSLTASLTATVGIGT